MYILSKQKNNFILSKIKAINNKLYQYNVCELVGFVDLGEALATIQKELKINKKIIFVRF